MRPTLSMSSQAMFTATVGLLLAGCNTTSYTVQVDAIAPVAETASNAPALRSYRIRTRNPKLDEDALRYKEVSNYVKTALSGRGMYEAPNPEAADVVIDIDYGMETPRVRFQHISKTVESSARYETKQTMQYTKGADSGLFITLPSEETRYVPGEVRQVDEVTPVIVYEKYLKVSARENKETSEGRAPAEVWSVNVSAEDKSQELRKYIPILASATADYIGTNTRQEKSVSVNEQDESVKFIKKGM